MKMLFALSILILWTGLIKAQTKYLANGKQYTNVRIYSKQEGVLKAKNLELVNDSMVSYTKLGSNASEKMRVKNLNYVLVKEGTHALKYGLISGGLGLCIVAPSALLATTDPNYVDSEENVAGIIIGYTLGIAAVGAIIGSFVPKWKKYYIHSVSTESSYFLLPYINNKSFGINLICTF